MFAVYETTTGQIVASFYDERDALSHADKLTNYSGDHGEVYAVMEIKVPA